MKGTKHKENENQHNNKENKLIKSYSMKVFFYLDYKSLSASFLISAIVQPLKDDARTSTSPSSS